jgi:hypothetical protein
VRTVATSENLAQLAVEGKLPEFVKPATEPAAPTAEMPPPPTPEQEQPKPATETSPAEEPKPDEKPAETADADADLPERARKRINAKHRELKEAEETGRGWYLEKLAAEKRVGELEAENAQLKKSTAPAPADEPKEPQPEDFATVQEYTAAAIKFGVQAELKERERVSAEKVAADAVAAVESAHEKRFAAFAAKDPEGAALVEQAEVQIRIPIMQFMRESDVGPELALHLARNADVVERLNRLSPIRALAEMGKLEATLAKPAGEKPRAEQPRGQTEVSKAPAPIRPLANDNAEPMQKDPARMTFKELRAHNAQQRRLKAQQGRGR